MVRQLRGTGAQAARPRLRPWLVATDAEAGPRRARPIATAAVIAAAVTALLAAPPGEALAYRYFSGAPHFDHLHLAEIKWWALGPMSVTEPEAYLAFYRGGKAWSGATPVTIIEDSNPNTTLTPLHMVARTWYDPNAGASGATQLMSYANKHWSSSPAAYTWLNLGIVRAYPAEERQGFAQAVAVHEMGHALGLDHVNNGCNATMRDQGIMAPDDSSFWSACRWLTPQPDDIDGVTALYADTK